MVLENMTTPLQSEQIFTFKLINGLVAHYLTKRLGIYNSLKTTEIFQPDALQLSLN